MISTLIGLALSLFGGDIIVYAQEPTIIEEHAVILIEVETEERRIERLVREEFKDAPIMVEVARCESGFKNVPSPTGDFGPYQVNQVHLKTLAEMELDRTKVEDNIKYARYLYMKNGLRDWQNSKGCWGKI